MKEDYCSYELSKLLKEKGFKQEGCHKSYSMEGPVAPTHQMAMKWLRKAHKIYADPIQQGNYDDNSIYYTYIVAQIIDGKSYIHRPMSVVDKLSYEEAVEAALKYVLENLI